MEKSYEDKLRLIGGKTIALVYIFEGETAAGSQHYAVWHADVIASWLHAVQELRCLPLIMDVRTFVDKAMGGTLPYIDYVINLNNGTTDLSALGLIPAVCAFLGKPCIPCNAISAIVGENKPISNRIAHTVGLNVPDNLPYSCDTGISRPANLGSSIGVIRGAPRLGNDLYQKFISGFDMTTPLLFHPVTGALEVLPSIMYKPDSGSPQWFLGAQEKDLHIGYKKQIVKIDPKTRDYFLAMAQACSVSTFCRIDCRVSCDTKEEMITLPQSEIPFERVFFIEINPMPTISDGINFHTSLQAVNKDSPFHDCLHRYQTFINAPSLTGFILSCALLSC